MSKILASITGVAGYVPDYILTNEELSTMVDTSDEWIMTRIGIKERRILKGEGLGSSYMAAEAVNLLLEKTGTKPEEVDMLILGTVTPDQPVPATANIVADMCGITNAFGYDINAGCSSFLYTLVTASKFIESGTHKKIVVVGSDKMSSLMNYQDRTTCPIFGDGAGAVLLEPNTEGYGLIDSILRVDGSGRTHLLVKNGGSCFPVTKENYDSREQYVYQEGQTVFKSAVSHMGDTALEVMERNGLTGETVTWLCPHQANQRIIDATGKRMGLSPEKVMVNIQRYGNTTSGTLPLCLWDWESKLRKGDNIIFAVFGAGFTWGASYLKWAYDGDKVAKK